MLLDLKKILFKEIENEIQEYKQYELIKTKILDIENKIVETEAKITEAKMKYLGVYPQRPVSLIKRYSFFEKWIFKRKEYLLEEKKYKEAQEEYKIKYSEYEKACSANEKNIENLNKQMEMFQKQKEELEKQCEQIENKGIIEIKERYDKIKNAKNLKELDLTFFEAIELLEKNNIELVLDENDKEICENESDFDKSEDFILIHKTRYIPSNNEIKSNLKSNAKEKYTLILGEEEISFKFLQGRNTIHFSQNGEVSSHIYGNFDNRKYAILVPYKNVENSKNLVSFASQDTYFDNMVNISNGYILCPKNEVEKIKQTNSKVMVVGYEGEAVDGFADSFISMLGYKYERVLNNGWANLEDSNRASKFKQKNNLSLGIHFNSFEDLRDNIITCFEKFVGFTKDLSNSKKNGKRYDKIKLLEALIDKDTKWIVEDESGYIKKSMRFERCYRFI